jgi:hypothetical protein
MREGGSSSSVQHGGGGRAQRVMLHATIKGCQVQEYILKHYIKPLWQWGFFTLEIYRHVCQLWPILQVVFRLR